MHGIDSNILLRFLLRDDMAQAQQVDQLIRQAKGQRMFLVDVVVLLETIWVLTARYKASREAILEMVEGLLAAEEFEVENRDAVELALGYAERRGVGFADALIAARNLAAGCHSTLTFDRDAAKLIPGMDLLA